MVSNLHQLKQFILARRRFLDNESARKGKRGGQAQHVCNARSISKHRQPRRRSMGSELTVLKAPAPRTLVRRSVRLDRLDVRKLRLEQRPGTFPFVSLIVGPLRGLHCSLRYAHVWKTPCGDSLPFGTSSMRLSTVPLNAWDQPGPAMLTATHKTTTPKQWHPVVFMPGLSKPWTGLGFVNGALITWNWMKQCLLKPPKWWEKNKTNA